MSSPFIDSNVVLYLLSADEVKADRAQFLVEAGAVISVQVLNEVTSVCLRKLKMPWEEIDALLEALKAGCEVLPITQLTHDKAIALAKRYKLAFYDANIVAAGILSGAKVLYSEDMHHGLQMDGLTIYNPFIQSSPK